MLISRARDGGLSNGASTNAVISNDRRWACVIAYQSDASNIVAGYTNGATDVFVVRRAGRFGNYIAFETEASNLGVNALRRRGDYNSRPDAYLYTGVRDLTLVQSVVRKAVPLWGGGRPRA